MKIFPKLYAMRVRLIIFIFMPFLFAFSCEKENEPLQDAFQCEKVTVISADEYSNAPNAPHFIQNASIDGNCLSIRFSASGCSGDSWQVKLIDAGVVMESYPPQRQLRLSLKNGEMCEAEITKEISFDISRLQVAEGKVYLNIDGYSESVLYSFGE